MEGIAAERVARALLRAVGHDRLLLVPTRQGRPAGRRPVEERRHPHQPSSLPARCALALDQRQDRGSLQSRARTGFSSTVRALPS